MADVASSAIVGEVVGRLFSGILNRHKGQSNNGGSSSIERLEMACIKLDAAVETSNKWQVTDTSVLRWRRKLKRAAQECDDTLRRCKQRSLEDEKTIDAVRQSSSPRRFAHATKSFVSSLVGHSSDEGCPRKAVVRRYERLADGADDFLRFVQFGGTRRGDMFFDSLIGNLFAGQSVEYQVTQHHGRKFDYFGIRPMNFEERGLEAMLAFVHEDREMPRNSFRLGLMLRLSESTDIIGVTVKCLQLITPHFDSTSKVVIGEFTQLPAQDFTWLQRDEYGSTQQWNNIHSTLTQWFRPDPLCCKQYERESMISAACCTNTSGISDMFPEPVIGVYLQRHVISSEYINWQDSTMRSCNASISREDFLPLKLVVLFMLHDPADATKFAMEAESSAIEAFDGKQQSLHVNVHPQQLDEFVLPKAINYFQHDAEAMIHHMSWKSTHGSAHLFVDKTSTYMLGELGAATQHGWMKKSRAFMGSVEAERGTEKVMALGTSAQRVVSFFLMLVLMRMSLKASKRP